MIPVSMTSAMREAMATQPEALQTLQRARGDDEEAEEELKEIKEATAEAGCCAFAPTSTTG